MTTELTTAAQQALEQLEFLNACYPHKTATDAADALRRALAQRPAAQTEREALRWTVSVDPVAVSGEPDAHCLLASIGNQAFHIGPDYMDTKQEAEFFAEMFLHAIEVGHRASLPAPHQATPEPVGEVVAYREKLTGRLCEPEDTHRRKFPMCYEPLTRPAPGVPDVEAAAKKLAECMD